MTSNTVKDYLQIDPEVSGQKFYCVSITGPGFRQKSDHNQVMIRGGAFRSHKEAATYAAEKTTNKSVDVYCAQIGYWSSFILQDAKIDDPNQELNLVMNEFLRAQVKKDLEFEKNTDLRIKNAKTFGKTKDKKSLQKEADDKQNIENAIKTIEGTSNITANKKTDSEEHVFESETPLSNCEYACISFITPQSGSTRSAYGLKVRGIFSTVEKCNELVQKLEYIEKKIAIHVVHVGEWLKWDPPKSELNNQIYSDPQINSIMQGQQNNDKNLNIYKQEMENENMKYELEQELKGEEARFLTPANNDEDQVIIVNDEDDEDDEDQVITVNDENEVKSDTNAVCSS